MRLSSSRAVPTDERVYEKHESVPNNPKLADVSFRSGDVESWGRGFLKIKAECMTINAPLPTIDAEGKEYLIEAQYIPAYPIVVIKENERVFADQLIHMGFLVVVDCLFTVQFNI